MVLSAAVSGKDDMWKWIRNSTQGNKQAKHWQKRTKLQKKAQLSNKQHKIILINCYKFWVNMHVCLNIILYFFFSLCI